MKTYARLVEGELDVLLYVPGWSNPTEDVVRSYASDNGYRELVRVERPGPYYNHGWHTTVKRLLDEWTPWDMADARADALRRVQAGLDAAVDTRRTVPCPGFDAGIVYDRNALINAMGLEAGDAFIDAADGLHTLSAEDIANIKAALLGQSIRGLRRLEASLSGTDVPVYVFDDCTHPLPSVPEGVRYEATSFPRNGNLIGVQCLKGMVDCYCRVFDAEPAAGALVKCDCDTILNGLGVAEGIGSGVALSGTKWGNYFVSGQRYAVTRDTAYAARDLLDRPSFALWLESTGIYGEDASFTMVCRRIPGCRMLFDRPGTRLVLRDCFSSIGDPAVHAADAVVFKRQTPVGGDSRDEREAAAALMRGYNDAMEAGRTNIVLQNPGCGVE